eukprot:gnl/MRDRNA2_/MRDRNA2_93272_c0_seq1.p1 gnl/MRDRNA2_/MRDRNA2_93272_c0~~gnl/MRDRNA2_/MRDRNA2_93272_c0_seq1.p1  ORF type:complete len:204 (+),score=23.93 gnl/MRDRNA2_/MRDRNA2_93272_c0_seq1:99-710(+)
MHCFAMLLLEVLQCLMISSAIQVDTDSASNYSLAHEASASGQRIVAAMGQSTRSQRERWTPEWQLFNETIGETHPGIIDIKCERSLTEDECKSMCNGGCAAISYRVGAVVPFLNSSLPGGGGPRRISDGCCKLHSSLVTTTGNMSHWNFWRKCPGPGPGSTRRRSSWKNMCNISNQSNASLINSGGGTTGSASLIASLPLGIV